MTAGGGPAAFAARLDRLERAVRVRSPLVPRLGIVLGSGLGHLAATIGDPVAIPYDELPGWPAPSARGHAGRLILGTLEGMPVACLQGRFHRYEGHPPALVAEPVLLLHRLGAGVLLLTNAAGGVDPSFRAGTLMAIADHLNLTGENPLVGPNDDALGPRFPDQSATWEPALRSYLHAAAGETGTTLAEGVYAGLLGPTYETPAEVRMLRVLGADAVGMSTVTEAIAARWCGMRVCGVSLVTNPGAGLSPTPLSHAEVLAAADEAGPRLEAVIRGFVRRLAAEGA